MKYVNKLSSEQILQFFGENGLVVLEDDLTGLITEANNENADNYYIRAGYFGKKEPTTFDMVRDYVYVKSGLAGLGLQEYSDDRVDIYSMSDYTVNRVFGFDFPNERDYALQNNYARFMAKTFEKEGYRTDYNAFVQEMSKEK